MEFGWPGLANGIAERAAARGKLYDGTIGEKKMKRLRFAYAVLVLLAGCGMMKTSPRPLSKTARLELYLVSPTKTPGSKPAKDPQTNAVIFLTTPPIITAVDVESVQRSEDAPNAPALAVKLTPAGATKLASATAKPKGKELAFVINGAVVGTFDVKDPLSTGFHISSTEIARNREQLFHALTNH